MASKTIYGGTYNLLEHTLPLSAGIATTFVDPEREGAFEEAIRENTKAIFIETLGNPNSNIIDIEEVAEIAHKHNIPLVVDSTFATPYLVRPLEYGADIVIHSATKFIGGHGTAVGGVVVDGGRFDWKSSTKYPWISEPNPSYHGVSFADAAGPAAFCDLYPRDTAARHWRHAFPLSMRFYSCRGWRRSPLRVERHVENALRIVDYLNGHPQVEAVHHPSLASEPSYKLYQKYFPNGGGSIFTFEIKGTAETARKFIDNLAIFSCLRMWPM